MMGHISVGTANFPSTHFLRSIIIMAKSDLSWNFSNKNFFDTWCVQSGYRHIWQLLRCIHMQTKCQNWLMSAMPSVYPLKCWPLKKSFPENCSHHSYHTTLIPYPLKTWLEFKFLGPLSDLGQIKATER